MTLSTVEVDTVVGEHGVMLAWGAQFLLGLERRRDGAEAAPVEDHHDVVAAADLDGLRTQRADDGRALLLARDFAVMGCVRPVLEAVRPAATIACERKEVHEATARFSAVLANAKQVRALAHRARPQSYGPCKALVNLARVLVLFGHFLLCNQRRGPNCLTSDCSVLAPSALPTSCLRETPDWFLTLTV